MAMVQGASTPPKSFCSGWRWSAAPRCKRCGQAPCAALSRRDRALARLARERHEPRAVLVPELEGEAAQCLGPADRRVALQVRWQVALAAAQVVGGDRGVVVVQVVIGNVAGAEIPPPAEIERA